MECSLLLSTSPPWILESLGNTGESRAIQERYRGDLGGLLVATLGGRRMSTRRDLFREFQRALELPDYFGRNWDALDECLADLDWLDGKSNSVPQGYVLVVEESQTSGS
ncbi:MAG: barstar family protein [Acidimicrobiales bacterium]